MRVKYCPTTGRTCDMTACDFGSCLRENAGAPITTPLPAPVRGWTCPTCGGGVAPFVSRCPCTPVGPLEVTCAAGGDWPAEAIGAQIRREVESRKNAEAKRLLYAVDSDGMARPL